MTNAVTKHTVGNALPVAENIPAPSRELGIVMREALDLCRRPYSPAQSVLRPDGGSDWFYPRMPAPSLIEEARRLLVSLRQIGTPAPAELREYWLFHIAAAVDYSPTEEDYAARLTAFHIAAEEIPAIAFNQATLRDIMRRHKYFPSCHDLVAALEVEAWAHARRVEDVERIANARPLEEVDAAREQFFANLPGRFPHHTPPMPASARTSPPAGSPRR